MIISAEIWVRFTFTPTVTYLPTQMVVEVTTIVVFDTGPGLSPDLSTVFQPNAQRDNSLFKL